MSGGGEETAVIQRGPPPMTVEDALVLQDVAAAMFGARRRPPRLQRYELRGALGRGGFGTVYRAFDPELGREVAIKLVRSRSESATHREEAEARLIREARAMARVSDPNIVEIYDVGRFSFDEPPRHDFEVPDRGVFIVMELIEGPTLADWLRTRAPRIDDILSVFTAAGRALCAAHAVGILHRDFKPTNVMIGADDRVRVLDFGLTYLLEGGSTQPGSIPSDADVSSPLTRAGDVLGTPRYMSPEQHEGGRVDARTDQYSFCVALHVALFAEPPFPQSVADELVAAKKRGLGRLPARPHLPAHLRRVLHRGLAPDPDRRYPDMDALLRELRPHARRGWLVAGLGVTVLAVGGLLAEDPFSSTTAGACEDAALALERRVTVDRDRIGTALTANAGELGAQTWARLRPRLEAYAQSWTAAQTESCRVPPDPVRGDCMHRAAVQFEALLEILAESDRAVATRAMTAAERLPDLETCLTQGDPIPADDELARTVGAVRDTLSRGRSLYDTGRYEEAASTMVAALKAAEASGYEPLVAEVLWSLGSVEQALGNPEAAGDHLARAVALAESTDHGRVLASAATQAVEVFGKELGDADLSRRYVRTAEAAMERFDLGPLFRAGLAHRQAAVAMHEARYDDAAAYAQAALDAHARIPDGLETHHVAFALAHIDARGHAGRTREAHDALVAIMPRVEAVFGPDHPNTLQVRLAAAGYLGALGRHDEAEPELREIVRLEEAADPDGHRTAFASERLGVTLTGLGRGDEAAPFLERARDIYAKVYGDRHAQVGYADLNLGMALLAAGRFAEARAAMEAALVIVEEQQPDTSAVAVVLTALAQVKLESGDIEGGAAAAERAVELTSATQPSVAFANAVGTVAIAANVTRDFARAERLANQAIAAYEAVLGPDSGNLSPMLLALGEARIGQRRASEAVEVLRRAVTVANTDVGKRGEAALGLAEALWMAGEHDEARRTAMDACEAFRSAGPRHATYLGECEAWIAEHEPAITLRNDRVAGASDALRMSRSSPKTRP